MSTTDHLRALALPLIQQRLTTIITNWETGSSFADQRDHLHEQVHQLIGTAAQAQLTSVAEAGRLLLQRLGAAAPQQRRRGDARVLVAEALAALQAAVAQVGAVEQPPSTMDTVEGRATLDRALAGCRVLLVEDSGDLAMAVEEGLKAAGCATVTSCGTVPAAQALLAPEQPAVDLALIDHRLGRASGATLAAWMRQQPHLAHTLRVSYSASLPEEVARTSAPGDFHAIVELRGLRHLVGEVQRLWVAHQKNSLDDGPVRPTPPAMPH